MMDINKVNVGGHFTHLILTHSLSSSDWFELLRGSFRFIYAIIAAVVAAVAGAVAVVWAALTFLGLTLC